MKNEKEAIKKLIDKAEAITGKRPKNLADAILLLGIAKQQDSREDELKASQQS